MVVSDVFGRVKLGITSGDPRMRLGDHKRDGYNRTMLVMKNVDAWPLEQAVLAELASRGYEAIHGREYFDWDALDLILSAARSWKPPSGMAA